MREYAARLACIEDFAARMRALFLFESPFEYRTVRGLPRGCFPFLFFPFPCFLVEVIYLNKLTS